MGLRERILEPLDSKQRMIFGLFFAITLFGNVGLELYVTGSYQFHFVHAGLLFGIIQSILNPQGVRLLFFCFFAFLMMKTFNVPTYANIPYIPSYNFDKYLLNFILFFLTTSVKVIVYTHVLIYGLLAYFSFKNPFRPKVKLDSELIDNLD